MSARVFYNDGFMCLPFHKACLDGVFKKNSGLLAALLLKKGKQVSAIFPESFYVRLEITNVCNYRCKFCPHKSMKRPLGFMEKRLYEKIIDDCARSGIRMVNLTSFGESLLDKDIIDKVRYAKNKGIPYLYLTTNGSLLDSFRAEELIRLGLDEARFSIDAVSAEQYSDLRDEYNYKAVMENILGLISLKKRLESNKPAITVCFIKRKDNAHQVEGFINTWKDKADVIHIQAFHNWAAGIDGGAPQRFVPCKRLWFTLNVFWDGRVGLCCADTEGRHILGDLRGSSIMEVYNSAAFQDARVKNLGADKNFICSRCTLPERDSLLWMGKLMLR